MIDQPKAPQSRSWRSLGRAIGPAAALVWTRIDGLTVLSAVEVVQDKDDARPAPAWHVSVSRLSAHGHVIVASDADVLDVRRDFQMDDADEDNHGPGVVRHLWLDCGKLTEKPCSCKADEPARVDGAREWRP